MRRALLVIDPQNDFMDVPGAALPVAGAVADMTRLAALIDALGTNLDQIVVTLDSHPGVAIERPGMWRTGAGGPVAPFTVITAAAVRAGEFRPARPEDLEWVLTYLDALESGGRYSLMVWPVHCEIGTWGHNVAQPLHTAYRAWELEQARPVRIVLKGMNPRTESYSALQAEVPDPSDPATQLNTQLGAELDGFDEILVGGEASSHCVAATLRHLAPLLRDVSKLTILSDCMSPVPGFESQAADFLRDFAAQGALVRTTTQWLAELDADVRQEHEGA